MLTTKDIARMAGVSRGTVDRVVHNRGKVAPEKEKRIREIIEKENYQPNEAAKGLAARKKTIRVGFFYIDDNVMSPFFTKVVEEARGYANVLAQYNHFETLFFPHADFVDYRTLDEDSLLQEIDGNQLNGIVIDGFVGIHYPETIRKINERNIPIVAFNSHPEKGEYLAIVSCDYRESGRIACGLAAMRGLPGIRVGIVSHDHGVAQSSTERVAGFREEMKNYPEMEIVSLHFLKDEDDRNGFFERAVQEIGKNSIDVLYLVNPGNYGICRMMRENPDIADIPVITNDLLDEEEREMLKRGEITACICQQPELQGSLPLKILFHYLVYNRKPEQYWYKTRLSIVLRQNADDEV